MKKTLKPGSYSAKVSKVKIKGNKAKITFEIFDAFSKRLTVAEEKIQVLEKLNHQLERDVAVRDGIIAEYRELLMQMFHEMG